MPTIASVLSENGYFTGMAGKWHIGKLPEDINIPVLEKDPYEQNNLAYKPAYQAELSRLQKILEDHLSTFDHAYSLADTSFMQTEQYKELVTKSKSYGTDYIPWLSRDHGSIQWPPVK